MKPNFFTDVDGVPSMRRFLACIFAIASIGLIVMCLIVKADWKIIAFSGGIPLIGCLLMMFFTSWADVSEIVNAVKK